VCECTCDEPSDNYSEIIMYHEISALVGSGGVLRSLVHPDALQGRLASLSSMGLVQVQVETYISTIESYRNGECYRD